MSSVYPNTDPYAPGQAPSPWFTVANQFLPRNLHDVIRWARYITIQSPTTTEVLRKYSTYPITDFIIDTKDEKLKTRYQEVFKSFKLKQSLHDIGFEYFTSGNVFLSIYFPIQRSLVCKSCTTAYNAKKIGKTVSFKNWKFTGTCPHCGVKGDFEVKDTKSVNVEEMNLIKWNPLNIMVNHNPITGEYEYYYKIPNDIKRRVQLGDTLFVNSLPMEFIEAIKNNQDFRFDTNNLFHLKNLSTGAMVEGVAVPPLLSLFSLVFYQATLRKANENIANEHLSPLRVVFPQQSSTNADPVVAMSLRSFVGNMEAAIQKHKKDKGYFLVAPGPIGYQAVGGEGKNLLVAQEIQQAEEAILLSLGVSRELLSGLTNWTSSTVGLRMLTNTLQSYVGQIEGVIEWIVGKVTSYLGIETRKVTLEPFSLMDDDVFKTSMINLASSDKVSMTTFFETFGQDYSKELDRLKEEKVLVAKNSIETNFEVEQAQILAGKDIGNKISDTGGDYKKILDEAQQYAEQLYTADEGTRRSTLHQLKMDSYPLYLMVAKLLEEYKHGSQHEQEIAAQTEQIGVENQDAIEGGENAQQEEMAEEGGDVAPGDEQSGPPGEKSGPPNDKKDKPKSMKK